MTENLLRCPICDSETLSVEVAERVEQRRNGTSLRYASHVTKCGSCDESFTTPAQSRVADAARTAALREASSALEPWEIRDLREEVGLSQREFEKLLCVGANNLSRWENGTVVPSGAANMLMRVVRAVPDALAYCANFAPRRPPQNPPPVAGSNSPT